MRTYAKRNGQQKRDHLYNNTIDYCDIYVRKALAKKGCLKYCPLPKICLNGKAYIESNQLLLKRFTVLTVQTSRIFGLIKALLLVS